MKSPDDALWKYLDDDLTPTEQRELDRAMRTDPSLVGKLVRFAMQEVALRELSGATAGMPVRHRWRRWAPPLALAASLLVALGIGLWLNRTTPETIVAHDVIASVEHVQGSAFGFADADATEPRPLRIGDEILFGMRIETGPDSAATLAWLDNTARLALAESTVISMPAGVPSVPVRASSVSLQKRMVLHQGALTATVAPQPAEQPFAVETPHALATALGTRFRLEVRGETGNGKQDARRLTLDARLPAVDAEHPDSSPNHQPSTILHVEDGRVRFMRLADRESVEVAAGEFAVAGDDFPLKPYPADTDWIEGRLVFEDDFSDGLRHWFLGQTRVNMETLMGADEPFAQTEGRIIEAARFRRDGREIPGIRMAADDNAGVFPFLMVNRPVTETAYVVEWEYAMLKPGKAGPAHPGQSVDDDLLFHEKRLRDFKTDFKKSELWLTVRVELTPLDVSHRPYTLRRRVYYSGRLASVARTAFQKELVGFSMQSGDVFLSRCTIRELVPVP